MIAFEKGWGVLKASRLGSRERDAAHRARLVDPKKEFSEYIDKPGGGHKDADGKLINPFYRIDKPYERDEDGGQGSLQDRNFQHHWEPSKFSNIMDLSDYPNPASHRARKKLEDILSGKMEKVETQNKETGLKVTNWKARAKPLQNDTHKYGLKHDNKEMLGRQALQHLQDLGLEAGRVRGHIFVKMPSEPDKKGDQVFGPKDDHVFYIPVGSHDHARQESWPNTIAGRDKKWEIDEGSQDPHTMRARKYALHSTGRRAQGPVNVKQDGKDKSSKMYQNHYIDYLNLMNPFHRNSILSKESKLEAIDPEKATKKRFEKQYWSSRDASQKVMQNEMMGGPPEGTVSNPNVNMTDIHPRLSGLIENELHAMKHWWEDPRLKAKDIKQMMPNFWHFSNLKWAPKHEQLPKKWWKNRANETLKLSQYLKEGPPHPSMQEPGTFDGGMSDTTSSLLERNKFRQQHGVTTDDGKLVPPLLPTGRAIDQDRGEVQPAGPGAIQPPTQKRGGLGLSALDTINQPKEPSPHIPPPNKRMPIEDVMEANKDVDPTIRRANTSPLEGAFDSIIKVIQQPQPFTGIEGRAPDIPQPNPDAGKIFCNGCEQPFPLSDIVPVQATKSGEGAMFDAFREVPQNERLCRSCRQHTSQGEQGMLNWGSGQDYNLNPQDMDIYVSGDRPPMTGGKVIVI